MLAAVTAINRQIHELAPVLNSAPLSGVAEVRASSPQCPIDILVQRRAGATYVFAAAMRNAAGRGEFVVHDLPATASAEVLGESRALPLSHGRFADDFAPYGVHLYRIRSGAP